MARSWSDTLKQPAHNVHIAVVGKYTGNGDAYMSIEEALKHGGIAQRCRGRDRMDRERLAGEPGLDSGAMLAETDGLIVAPGFGGRGVEGKIEAIRYAREIGPAVLRHLSTACKWP